MLGDGARQPFDGAIHILQEQGSVQVLERRRQELPGAAFGRVAPVPQHAGRGQPDAERPGKFRQVAELSDARRPSQRGASQFIRG